MASYNILPLREEGIDLATIQNCVENMSALEVDADLRSGTLPRTFRTFQGEMCYVEYAEEDYADVTTLEGDDEQIKVADMFPIIFLGNSYVAYDANLPNKDVENKIINLISDLLGSDIRYEAIEFDSQDLEAVVEKSDKVEAADWEPETREKPETVKMRHLPGLQETESWDEYAADPMKKVKVTLPDESVYRISFYEEGKITVHGRNIDEAVQVDVLRYITDEVISHLNIDTYQKKLGGEYT